MPEPEGAAGLALDPEAIARLRRLGGEELTRTVANLFLELAPRRLGAARTALDTRDADGVRRAAHSLKSSAGNIGALVLLRCAGRLEAAAEEDASEATLRSLLEAATAAYEAALPELKALGGEHRGSTE